MPVVPAILLLALFSIIYSVKIFQDLVSLNKEKSDRLILEKQIHNLQEHIEEIYQQTNNEIIKLFSEPKE